jgi:rubrerythrin
MLDKQQVQEMLLQMAADAEEKAIKMRRIGDHHAVRFYRQQAEGYLEDAILCEQQ